MTPQTDTELPCDNPGHHRAHRYVRLPGVYYTCQGRTAEVRQQELAAADHEPVHDHVFGVRCRPDCPRWMNPVPQPGWEPEQDWYFTFGANHTHPETGQRLGKNYVRIHGTADSTRETMLAAFGKQWAFQYSTAEKAMKVDRWNLTEVSMPGQQPSVDDDEALREVYAQDEADQDRVPTEAGFDVWKSLRRAVGPAEPTAAAEIPDVQHQVRVAVTSVQSLLVRLRVADRENARQPSEDLATAADDIADTIDDLLNRIDTAVRGDRR